MAGRYKPLQFLEESDEVEVLEAPLPETEFQELLAEPFYSDRSLVFSAPYFTASRGYTTGMASTMLSDLLGDTDHLGERERPDLFKGQEINGRSVFVIKSAMGTGKTTFLHDYMSLVSNIEKEKDKVFHIVAISCRVSLGEMYYNKFKDVGFTYYREIVGPIDEDRIICSPESYARMEATTAAGEKAYKNVDILIIDEFETFLNSLPGLTMKGRRGLFYNIFPQYWKSEHTQLVIMDATLTPMSMRLIRDLTNRMTGVEEDDELVIPKSIYTFYNTHRPAFPGQIEITQNSQYFSQCITDAISHCYRNEWQVLDQMAIMNDEPSDMFELEYQVIIVYASLKELEGMYNRLLKNNPSCLSKNNVIMVTSKTGGQHLNVDSWRTKRVILHTSTIAAGSDYNPVMKGRNVHVFSVTNDNIVPDLMAQMTFRARLPIVAKVLFFVPVTEDKHVQLITNRQGLLDSYEATASFLSNPVLAMDRCAYSLVVKEIDGTLYRVPRLNCDDFGLQVVLHQHLKDNLARNNYIEYLINVLSDISMEWYDRRERKSFVALTKSVDPKRDAIEKHKTVEDSHEFATRMILGAIAAMEAVMSDDTETPISDVMTKYDVSKIQVKNRSNYEQCLAYEICTMLKEFGLASLPPKTSVMSVPGQSDWCLMKEIIEEKIEWYSVFYETYKEIAKGTEAIDRMGLHDHAMQIDTRYHGACTSLKVHYILSALHALIPSSVRVSDGEILLCPLYSELPGLHHWDQSTLLIPSSFFRDADRIDLIRLSNENKDIYNPVFAAPRGFPVPIDGKLNSTPGEDPAVTKKRKASVIQLCDKLCKQVLRCAGYSIKNIGKTRLTIDGESTFQRNYQVTQDSRDIAAITRLREAKADFVRFRENRVATIMYSQVTAELRTWKYLGLWKRYT